MTLTTVNFTSTPNITSYGDTNTSKLHDKGLYENFEPDNSLERLAYLTGNFLRRMLTKEIEPFPQAIKPQSIVKRQPIPSSCRRDKFENYLSQKIEGFTKSVPEAKTAYHTVNTMRNDGDLTRSVIESVVCLDSYWVMKSVPVTENFLLDSKSTFPLYESLSNHTTYSTYLRSWFWQSFDDFTEWRSSSRTIPVDLVRSCWQIFTDLHMKVEYCKTEKLYCDDPQVELASNFPNFFADFETLTNIKITSRIKCKIGLSYLHAFAPEPFFRDICPELYNLELNEMHISLRLYFSTNFHNEL